MVTSYGTGLLGKPSHDNINKLLEYEIKMLEVFYCLLNFCTLLCVVVHKLILKQDFLFLRPSICIFHKIK